MSDPDSAVDSQLLHDSGEIETECRPMVRRLRLGAAPVAARLRREAAPVRELPDHLVPTASMKPAAMSEQQGRTFPGPVPHSEVKAIDG